MKIMRLRRSAWALQRQMIRRFTSGSQHTRRNGITRDFGKKQHTNKMARSYSSDQEEDIQEEYSDGTVSSVEEEPARSAASQLNFVPLGQLAVVEAKFHSSSLAGDIKRRDFRTIGTGRTDKRQGDDGDDDDDDDGRNANPIRKRQSKHSPMEVSSKKPMSRKRQVVELSGYKARDPRFDPLCGQFSQNEFDQKYSFVDDYRRSEIRVLKSELAKKKSPKARASTNEEELEEKQRELNQLITKMVRPNVGPIKYMFLEQESNLPTS